MNLYTKVLARFVAPEGLTLKLASEATEGLGLEESAVDGGVTLHWEDAYRHDSCRLRVHGRSTTSTHELRRFVQARVRDRLRRASSREQLREYLNELTSTGFATANLSALVPEDPEWAPWEIGEVLAEVLLEETERAEFPWPPSWDKRSATASLPGPDFIGFLRDEAIECFLFGEVKSSDADDVRASVINGDDGLRRQIERLLSSEDRRQLLISWLCVRAKGQAWQATFDRCLAVYLADPCRYRKLHPPETSLKTACSTRRRWMSSCATGCDK
jgi:hypothetical protein